LKAQVLVHVFVHEDGIPVGVGLSVLTVKLVTVAVELVAVAKVVDGMLDCWVLVADDC